MNVFEVVRIYSDDKEGAVAKGGLGNQKNNSLVSVVACLFHYESQMCVIYRICLLKRHDWHMWDLISSYCCH